MAPRKKLKTYSEEIGFKKSPRDIGDIAMKALSSSCLVDDKRLATKIMGMKSNDSLETNSSHSVDVKSMKIDEKNAARVLSGAIMEVEFFPTKDTRMVAVGNTYGNVGFWNIDSDEDDDNGIYVYYPHTGCVSGISIHPYSLSKIITSCYDGFVRLLDVEKESFGLAYTSEHPIFSICRPYDNMNSLFIGEEHGSVGSLDIRSSKPNSSWKLHKEKIYTIDFNSQNTKLMATSSKDKTACIWDLRKLDHLNPQPLKLVNHNGAVNLAYFSPSGNLLATTSKDDKIGLMSGANYDVECMINHPNYTSRFISSFRGIWGWDDGFIMVGNTKLKGVDVICAEEKKLTYTMTNRDINAIPCRFDTHPMLPGVLAISTAGGRVYVWDI
ncbi:uncharacterized protein LOC143546005 [Bidens hawaiensis]|uniref:uncharacterized protein LOC143546005 n=1 Tax=Bidens hawaiensis TaxID=980011 RepID=UPI00404A9A45